jgi:CheY-like chemotaxis protein
MTASLEQTCPIDILLVEDNPGDIRLVREAMRDSRLLNRLHSVKDGQSAIEFLWKQGVYADAVRPDLILLDLNLPKKDGREVLAQIKSDDNLRRIPVVIFSSSQAEEDILKSYNYHANCYVTKPVDFEKFMTVVQSIQDFWVSIVKLSPK